MDGIAIAFDDDRSIYAKFPQTQLQLTPPAHGDPGGDGFLGCHATVQFDGFGSGQRFAISNVTWYNDHLNLTKGTDLHILKSIVDFTVEHTWNFNPINLSVNPGIGLDGYEGEFKFTQDNREPVWSTCFGGYGSNVTKIDFMIQAWTKGPGDSWLFSALQCQFYMMLISCWCMDSGLIWESCYPPAETSWGKKTITDWQSYTYRKSNLTCIYGF
ncbi:hypothetical protein M426DRAFT_26606 [Hypoxylon sp. CI-4A]|nr:hypothetical protein M426DRAFT_26606 [Hypoxylon sp. CI-4A]